MKSIDMGGFVKDSRWYRYEFKTETKWEFSRSSQWKAL